MCGWQCKGRGLTMKLPTCIDQIPDHRIVYPKTSPSGGDPYTGIVIDKTIFSNPHQQLGTRLTPQRFGGQAGGHDDQLFRGQFEQLKGQTIAVKEQRISVRSVRENDARQGPQTLRRVRPFSYKRTTEEPCKTCCDQRQPSPGMVA